MKARELRIGNFVTYNGKVISVSPVAINEFYYIGDTHADSTTDKRDYKPIPLTEDWLFKFGFEIYSDYDYRNFILPKNKFIVSMWIGEGQPAGFEESGVCYWGESYLAIRTVHQLQNLYFILTGIELEIKESSPL